MFKRIGEFVVTYPKTIIVVSIVITLAFCVGFPRLRIDDNIKDMIPENMDVQKALNKLEDIYGSSDAILIGINNEKQTVFNIVTLAKIKQMTDTLKTFDGIYDVVSLSTLKSIKGTDAGIEITPFLEEEPSTNGQVDSLKMRFFEDSTYVGQIVSKDAKNAAVVALLMKNTDEKKVYSQVKNLVNHFKSSDDAMVIAGYPAILAEVSKNLKADIQRLIPFVILVMAAILFLSLRTGTGVWIPLLTVLMATASAVGLMGIFNRPFMMINNTMPMMLIAIRASAAVIVLALFYEHIQNRFDKKTAIVKTVEEISVPVLGAGIAAAIGFASLVTSPLPAHRELGLFSAFGVLMSALFTVITVPAFLAVLPAPKKYAAQQSQQMGLMDKFLAICNTLVVKHHRATIITGIVVVVVFVFGIPHLRSEMNPITYFSKKSVVWQDDQIVNKNNGGSMTMNLLLSGDVQDPIVLNRMDKVQTFLERYPEVTSTLSMATVMKKINKAMHANDPSFEVIPKTKDEVSQALLLYSMGGSPKDFERFTDNPFQNAQISMRMVTISTSRIRTIGKEVQHFCDSLTQAEAATKIEITGFSMLLKDLADMIVDGSIYSLIGSGVVIFFVILVIYRSWKLASIGIIPLLMTIIIIHGFMGFSGIELSIPTVILSGIIVGVGIDFSLYFISRYVIERQRASDKTTAVSQTILTVGKPILYTALSVAFGFLVLLVSGFMPIRLLGMLISIAMVICGIGAVTVLASVILVSTKGKNTTAQSNNSAKQLGKEVRNA